MTATADQIEQFQTHGYTAIPHFFDPREVKAMQAEVARWIREGLIRNVTTEGDGTTHSKDKLNLQLIPLFPKSDLFRALPFEQKVIDTVTSLIGDPILLHLDQMFYKPAKHGMGTSWHQDNAYFKINNPLRGTAMWIAIHDATVANGTIHVIPDMFNEQLEHERDPYSDHHIRCYPDESNAVPVELEAGGVAFFCYGTPHCTLANTTDGDRAGVALHFLHVDNARDDLIEDTRDARPYLTGPKATGGEKEYGVDCRNQWQGLVDKTLEMQPTG